MAEGYGRNPPKSKTKGKYEQRYDNTNHFAKPPRYEQQRRLQEILSSCDQSYESLP